MKRLLPILLLGILVMGPQTSAAESDDDRLAGFFKAYLDEEAKLHPLDATRLGDHRYDDQLDDLSPKARATWTGRTKSVLEKLQKEIDPKKLTRSGQIDFEILKTHLTRTLWLAENTNPYEQDAHVWNEYISDSVFLLLAQSTVEKRIAVQNAASRIAQIPRIVASARESLKDPPRVFVETAIRQNRGAIAFYESGVFELAGETPVLSEMKPVAKKAVEVLKDYQKFLEEDLLPRAKGDWRLGKDRFYRKFDLEMDANLTAEQVYADAEAEFDRVRRDMYVIARQLWSTTFPDKPLPPDDEEGRSATIRLVLAELGKDHGKIEDLVKDTKATVERIKTLIKDKDVLRLPDPDRCQIIEMPEFQRGNSTAYLNPAPPLDPKAASIYAVGPPPKDWDARRVASYLEEYNKHMLQILTIHEAYPGHYVQLEYSNRNPSLIRKVLSSGVFAEGWAVYTEQMMLDQGYGQGDLALRLHQLKFYLRAVTNTILDHKMHCTRMTDEEVMDLLVKKAFQSEGEAFGKVVRAKQSSVQLSTYFVGRMAFYRLRQQTQRELGEKFDLGRYHEAVLAHGTLPVKYLPELVKERLSKPR